MSRLWDTMSLCQGFASKIHACSTVLHWHREHTRCTLCLGATLWGQRLVPSKDGGATATIASWTAVVKPLVKPLIMLMIMLILMILMIIDTLVVSLCRMWNWSTNKATNHCGPNIFKWEVVYVVWLSVVWLLGRLFTTSSRLCWLDSCMPFCCYNHVTISGTCVANINVN